MQRVRCVTMVTHFSETHVMSMDVRQQRLDLDVPRVWINSFVNLKPHVHLVMQDIICKERVVLRTDVRPRAQVRDV